MASAEQLKEIEQQKTRNRIPPWHAAGIKGQGVVALNFETPGLPEKHCESCTERFKDAAPESTVHNVGISENTPGVYAPVCTHYKPGQRIPVEDVIRETGARIGIRSTGGKVDDDEQVAYWKMIEDKYNFILVTVPGMNNGDKPGGAFPAAVSIYVGACSISDSGKITQPIYTLTTPYIKFVNFRGYLEGMSFSAPYTAGMVALLLQKYPWLRREDVIAYFKKHCVDLKTQGFDDATGWGVPIMGDPKTIIKLQIGSNIMTVDGMDQQIDQPFFIVEETGRSVGPVRAPLEALGCKVTWYPTTQTIIIEK